MKYALMLGVDYARLEKMAVVDDAPILKALCAAIGCEYGEIINAEMLPEGYVMVVDEEGLLHGDCTLNVMASYLYGTHNHGQPIVGNAILIKEVVTPEGADLAWLTKEEVDRLEAWAEDHWRRSVRAISNWYYSEQEAATEK